jgi:hypothetical protein
MIHKLNCVILTKNIPMFRLSVIAFLCLFVSRTYATTWDEPWTDKVIKNATSFVLASVIENDEEKGVKINIIKTIAGQEIKDSLWINSFYLLNLCSSSGHGTEFQLTKTDSCFFFLKKDSTGEYSIATPTTGYAYVIKGRVIATYRHSYHRASAPYNIYLNTMTAIYNNYHGLPYDKSFAIQLADEYLKKKPAALTEEGKELFFLQHVAMETVFHLRLPGYDQLLLPFLNDSLNFHNQVSAARALRSSNTPAAKQALIKVIADSSAYSFVQVMCVWSLSEMNIKDVKEDLQKIHASDERAEFQSNLMDPRVCTYMPSVKEALDELLAKQ